MIDTDELISLATVADMCHVSRQAVRAWTTRGLWTTADGSRRMRLGVVLVGGRPYVRRGDVLEFARLVPAHVPVSHDDLGKRRTREANAAAKPKK